MISKRVFQMRIQMEWNDFQKDVLIVELKMV